MARWRVELDDGAGRVRGVGWGGGGGGGEGGWVCCLRGSCGWCYRERSEGFTYSLL